MTGILLSSEETVWSCRDRGVIPELGKRAMVGWICEKGSFKPGVKE